MGQWWSKDGCCQWSANVKLIQAAAQPVPVSLVEDAGVDAPRTTGSGTRLVVLQPRDSILKSV